MSGYAQVIVDLSAEAVAALSSIKGSPALADMAELAHSLLTRVE